MPGFLLARSCGGIVIVRDVSRFFRITDSGAATPSAIRAIDQVSLDIPHRHFISIVSATGYGKTTLPGEIQAVSNVLRGTS